MTLHLYISSLRTNLIYDLSLLFPWTFRFLNYYIIFVFIYNCLRLLKLINMWWLIHNIQLSFCSLFSLFLLIRWKINRTLLNILLRMACTDSTAKNFAVFGWSCLVKSFWAYIGMQNCSLKRFVFKSSFFFSLIFGSNKLWFWTNFCWRISFKI